MMCVGVSNTCWCGYHSLNYPLSAVCNVKKTYNLNPQDVSKNLSQVVIEGVIEPN